MTSNIFHVFLNVRRFEKEHLSEKVPVLKSHEKSEIMVLLLEVVIEEVHKVTKQLVRDVYFEISRENEIDELAKKLAYTNISEVENEKREINELAKKLAYTTISEVEKEENKINELAKKLAYTTISEVENEENEINELAKKLAYTTIFEAENEENEINELAKQFALKSILQAESEESQLNQLAKQVSLNSISVAENKENENDQLAKKLVSKAVMEPSSEVKIELAQSKQLNGQSEIADSALFEDSVPIEEIFQEFMTKGADINDISSIADKFVGNIFHGIFTKEEEEQESEISSIAKSLIENFLSTEVDDSALFARLDQIIDEVFADVDDDVVDVENESQQNILDKQQPSLSPATLEMQTQPISTLPTTLNDITTADEGAVANSIQQQQAPPLSKWRRFKNFFTCCWRPVVYDDDCQ